jgi:hypothetical protein
MEGFFTLKSLLTYSGAAAAAAALTQIIKPLAAKLPFQVSARFITYITALIITLAATVLSGSKEPADYALCTVNAALISLSSNGGYDLIKSLMSDNDDTEDNDEDNS